MIRAATVSSDYNLQELSHFLALRQVPHRISEAGGKQVIWVHDEKFVEPIKELLREILAKGQDQNVVKQTKPNESANVDSEHSLYHPPNPAIKKGYVHRENSSTKMIPALLQIALHSPVTSTLFFLCMLVALITSLGNNLQSVTILFFPAIAAESLEQFLGALFFERQAGAFGILRSVTPMFLHFGELHLIFNMLWLWFFGKQIEQRYPSYVMLLLVILLSFAANITQYLLEGSNAFGGMSGVVYGLVGFCFIVKTLVKDSNLESSASMFGFFVVSGIAMEVFASSWIASEAHLGGFLAGITLGFLFGAGQKYQQRFR